MSHLPTCFYSTAIASIKNEQPRLVSVQNANAFIKKVEYLLEKDINNEELTEEFEKIRPSYGAIACQVALDPNFRDDDEQEILFDSVQDTFRDTESKTGIKINI